MMMTTKDSSKSAKKRKMRCCRDCLLDWYYQSGFGCASVSFGRLVGVGVCFLVILFECIIPYGDGVDDSLIFG